MNKKESAENKAICNGCPYLKNLPKCECAHKRAMVFVNGGLSV